MTARCADMDAAPEALRLERRLGLGRAISAVAEHGVRCVAPVQEPIQLLAIMDCRVAHVVAPDQLVLGIRIHVVLVAVKAFAVLLRPACILVFLPVLGRLLLPIVGRLAALDGLVLLARVTLSGHHHDGGIDDLPTAGNVPCAPRCWSKRSKSVSIKPALASFSRNSHNVVPSGIWSSIPSRRNRVNDSRSRT